MAVWADNSIYGDPFRQNIWLKIDIDDLSKYRYFKENGGVGENRNMYTISCYTNKVKKYEKTAEEIFTVSNNFSGYYKWSEVVLHPNSFVYVVPHDKKNY